MPPKMFKIKKAEKGPEDDNTDDLVISDYQQQRLLNQAQQAEVKQAEETKRQAEAEAASHSVKAVAESNTAAQAKTVRPRGLANAAPPRPATNFSSTASYGIAEALPVNTMDTVLGAPAPAGSNYYPPMALKPVTDEPAASGLVSAPPIKSGTAFLEEAHRERLGANSANKAFFDQYAQRDTDDANTDANHEAFMLMQLPKPVRELASSCTLEQMAPGRIGKLTVYKSGRTTMTIGNVTVDVALEPQHTQSAGGEGISQYAVAVDSTDRARRGCYQMCWVPRKVVCTPQLEEE